jgi:hypothetical protein
MTACTFNVKSPYVKFEKEAIIAKYKYDTTTVLKDEMGLLNV